MDKPARKGEAVRDKRMALEQALCERLSEMRASYFGQCSGPNRRLVTVADWLLLSRVGQSIGTGDASATVADTAVSVGLIKRLTEL